LEKEQKYSEWGFFVIKLGETKEKFLYKKEEEMWHLILIARNNNYVHFTTFGNTRMAEKV